MLLERKNRYGYEKYLSKTRDGYSVIEPQSALKAFVSNSEEKYFFGSDECLIAAAETYCVRILVQQQHARNARVIPLLRFFIDAAKSF